MNSAVHGPWATSATSTATMPDSSAPMIGMNAPRKTSTPIANVNGTPSTQAPNAMPNASVSATITVARTNAVSDAHAV